MLNPDSKSWRNYILKIKWRQLSCSILPKFYPEPYTCKNIVWTHIGIFYILSSFKHLCLSGYTLLIRLYWSFTYTATDQSPSSMVIVWHLIPLKRKKERVSCNLAQSKKGGKREGKGKKWKNPKSKNHLTDIYLHLHLHVPKIYGWHSWLKT